MMGKKKHRLGWVPDVPDMRDHRYSLVLPPVLIPRQVDLRSSCPPIEDQGDLGSCTSFALVGALEFLELQTDKPFIDLSHLFVYYGERVLEGSVLSDSGAMLRDGIKTLARQGVCAEQLWPYNVKSFAKKPSPSAFKDAMKRQILSYKRITTLEDMRNCLARGFPFVFGFAVYESFESQEVAHGGIVPMPEMDEKQLGGHAVLAVGYDMDKDFFIVRNSWNKTWGDQGYFYMPTKYIADPNLCDDFWFISLME
jgi:C1A family cysteine protease